jgi:hypothetical protein
MSFVRLMDGVPLWALFSLLVFIIAVFIELGHRLGRRELSKNAEARRIKSSTAVGAGLGLLAFILAFTFSATTNRFDARKQLVLAEANAIGTVYLRADLLDPARREQVQSLLRDYTLQRYEAVVHFDPKKRFGKVRAAGEAIQAQLWSLAVAAAQAQPTPIVALFIDALNEIVNLDEERFTVALVHRMPPVFWGVLFAVTLLTMLLDGYDGGVSRSPRRPWVDGLINVAFSLVLILVIALDRPYEHLAVISEQPYIDLLSSMGIDNP